MTNSRSHCAYTVVINASVLLSTRSGGTAVRPEERGKPERGTAPEPQRKRQEGKTSRGKPLGCRGGESRGGRLTPAGRFPGQRG